MAANRVMASKHRVGRPSRALYTYIGSSCRFSSALTFPALALSHHAQARRCCRGVFKCHLASFETHHQGDRLGLCGQALARLIAWTTSWRVDEQSCKVACLCLHGRLKGLTNRANNEKLLSKCCLPVAVLEPGRQRTYEISLSPLSVQG